MSLSTSKVGRNEGREGLQAGLASEASGRPSAAANTIVVFKENSDTQACQIDIGVDGDKVAQNGDAAIDTTSGHEVTKIASDVLAITHSSNVDKTVQQDEFESSASAQDDDTTEGSESVGERDDGPHEEQSEPQPLPTGSRGPKETLADYIERAWTCEIKRASMQDWNKLSWSDVERPLPIIEAFYLNKPQSSVRSLDYNERTSGVPQILGEPRNLQRIMINSEYLCQELKNLSSLPAGRNVVVISPPYKVLMRSLEHLEARLAELQARMDDPLKSKSEQDGSATEILSEGPSYSTRQLPETKLSATAGYDLPRTETKDHSDEPQIDRRTVAAYDTDDEDALLVQVRYAHIKALVDFVKDDLGDVLRLRSQIKSGTLPKIHFEDLWHLFEAGELIHAPSDDGSAQLYKSYFLSGGQSLKRPRTNAETREISNIRERASYFLPREIYEGKEEEDLVDEFLREESSNTGTWTPFKIDSYYMQFDGERCGPVEICHKIWPFEGEQCITSLRIYPLRFHQESDAVLKAMIRRGREFLFDEGYKSYDGKTCYLERGKSQVSIHGDVYVDATAYYQDFPATKPRLGRIQRSSQNSAEVEEYCIVSHVGKTSALEHDASQPPIGLPYDPDFALRLSGHELDVKLSDEFLTVHRLEMEAFIPHEEKVSDNVLALMPRICHGFSFQLRQWFPLSLDRLNKIDVESDHARKKGFEDLVISKRYQDLLVALVNSHASGLQRGKDRDKNSEKAVKLTQIDIVRGKGQGLIILLHGPPGSGKTSTAETIAAYTRRPLYSITCGDIGTEPMVVESKLLEHTRRADRWGCVLLLDEADVFLVQRDWHNLHRNALTSIFLRQLEYYSGILFLTTNRPGVIDEAFKSRIHISLRYPGVDLESTMMQWKNILHRLEEENQTADVKIVFDRDVLLDFAKNHYEKCDRQGVTWNGRQIRNAFQTAIALGHYERISKIREAGMTPEEALKTGRKKWRTVKLTKANFANIAKTAREFEQYIETLRGSDSQNARESELRYDEYDPERPRARKQYPGTGSSGNGVRELQENMRAKAGGGNGKTKKGGRTEPPAHVDDEDEEEEEDDDSDDDEEDEDEVDDDDF